jgi:hypothetical protein
MGDPEPVKLVRLLGRAGPQGWPKSAGPGVGPGVGQRAAQWAEGSATRARNNGSPVSVSVTSST